MTDPERTDQLLSSAATELREQLDDATVPEFRPPSPNGQRAAFAIALIALLGGLLWVALPDRNVTDVDIAEPAPADTTTPTTLDDTPATDTPTTTIVTFDQPGTPSTGYDPASPLANREPTELLATTPDPTWGTPTRRLTATESTDSFHRVESPHRNIVNADGTRILAIRDGEWTVVERATGTVSVLALNPGAQPNWHPTEPTIIRHLSGRNSSSGSMLLQETVLGGTTTTLADLGPQLQATFPAASHIHSRLLGAPSADGNRYAWAVYDEEENVLGFVTWDVQAAAPIGTLVGLPSGDLGPLDSVAIGRTGNTVVLALGNDIIVYDADFTNERRLGQRTRSYDTALNTAGGDVLVTRDLDSGSDNAGWIVAYDLTTGTATRLHDSFAGGNSNIDFSGAATDLPGWVLASTHSCNADGGWDCDRLMAMNVDDGTIVNLAHTYSCAATIFTQPAATVNRDFSLAWFTTDFGSCEEDGSIIELSLPPVALATG